MGVDEAGEMTPEVIPRGLPEDVKHVAHVPAARPTVAKPGVAEQGVDKEIKEVMVSRKRVVAPPDRFIGVDDTILIQALQGNDVIHNYEGSYGRDPGVFRGGRGTGMIGSVFLRKAHEWSCRHAGASPVI